MQAEVAAGYPPVNGGLHAALYVRQHAAPHMHRFNCFARHDFLDSNGDVENTHSNQYQGEETTPKQAAWFILESSCLIKGCHCQQLILGNFSHTCMCCHPGRQSERK